MGMLIFSGLAYVSEKDEQDTEFISMPQVSFLFRSTNTEYNKFGYSQCASIERIETTLTNTILSSLSLSYRETYKPLE